MGLPEVVSRQEWLAARKELLAQEKELTRRRDALNTVRRLLPMVEIEKDYAFEGPDGEASLLDLFDGRRQLMVSHFMFDPSWDESCPSCSAGADEMSDGLRRHLHTRDTTLVYVSRAPLAKIEAYNARKGWAFPWYSSYGSDFNYGFHVTSYYIEGEQPGLSCFLRDGDRVFHTYATFTRGVEALGGSYAFLDLTGLGRQEEWEEPKDRTGDARGAIPDFSS